MKMKYKHNWNDKKKKPETININWLKMARYAGIVFIVIGLALMYVMYDMKQTKEKLDSCKAECEAQGYPRAGIHQYNKGCYCAEIVGDFRPLDELKKE